MGACWCYLYASIYSRRVVEWPSLHRLLYQNPLENLLSSIAWSYGLADLDMDAAILRRFNEYYYNWFLVCYLCRMRHRTARYGTQKQVERKNCGCLSGQSLWDESRSRTTRFCLSEGSYWSSWMLVKRPSIPVFSFIVGRRYSAISCFVVREGPGG